MLITNWRRGDGAGFGEGETASLGLMSRHEAIRRLVEKARARFKGCESRSFLLALDFSFRV